MATAQLGAVVRLARGLSDGEGHGERTDGELLAAFLDDNGDNARAAFEALVRRHGPMVLRVCRRALGNAHDAEDALQATFLVLARKVASVRKRESLASWLHGVAYRMATDAKKAAGRRTKHESRADAAQPSDPAMTAAWKEIQALIDEGIAGLPETLRGTFILCCLERKSNAEAARQLGLTEAAVGMRLSRARKLLGERLTRRGVSLAAALAAVAVGSERAPASVSRFLCSSTAEAAAQMAAGQEVAAGLVSTEAAAFTKGALKTMFPTKLKTTAVVFLAVVLSGTGAGVLTLSALGVIPGQAAEPGRARADEPKAGADPAGRMAVTGRVLDSDGKPVAGAKLYLARSAPAPVVRDGVLLDPAPTPGKEVAELATSGPDGRFRLDAPRPKADADKSTWQVMAVAKDLGCDWAEVGAGELTLRLVKDVTVKGRVLDPDGKPVAGAKLSVAGVYAFKGDDLTGYLAEFHKGRGDGLYYFPTNIGHKNWLSNSPPKGWVGPVPGLRTPLVTGADGRFELTGLGRERVVSLRLEGATIATAKLAVMTRAAEPVTSEGSKLFGASFDYVSAAFSKPIRGVVRDLGTGKPVAGASVRHQYGLCEAVTDKDGRYELLGVPRTKSNWLRVTPAEGQLYFRRQVEVRDTPGLDPRTADIEMVKGDLTVLGKVTDKTTGKPIAGARVVYHPLYGNKYVNAKVAGVWGPHSEATTGPDGAYTLPVLPGQGVIGVAAPDYDRYKQRGSVSDKELGEFFKEPLPSVAGRRGLYTSLGAITGVGDIGSPHNALVLLEPGEKDEKLERDVALEPKGPGR